jgi:uncharacterized membrane protein
MPAAFQGAHDQAWGGIEMMEREIVVVLLVLLVPSVAILALIDVTIWTWKRRNFPRSRPAPGRTKGINLRRDIMPKRSIQSMLIWCKRYAWYRKSRKLSDYRALNSTNRALYFKSLPESLFTGDPAERGYR